MTDSVGDVVVDEEGAGLLEGEGEGEVGEAGAAKDGGGQGGGAEPDVAGGEGQSADHAVLVSAGGAAGE